MNSVPRDFLIDSARALVATYADALKGCVNKLPLSEAKDILPYWRRASFDAYWRDIARRHDGIQAITRLNAGRNSSHTEIMCGPVILTASFVPTANTMVREARFRQTLARSSQLVLPGMMTYQDEEACSTLYAILIHGSASSFPAKPDFIRIAFPSPDCLNYVDQIDLMAMTAASLSDSVEVVPDDLGLRLRPGIAAEEERADA